MADVQTFRDLRTRVLAAARTGRTLDEIDESLIEPAGLDDESKAALWITARHEITYHQAAYQARQAAVFDHPAAVVGTD